MADIFLYPGEPNPNDIVLSDPTTTRTVFQGEPGIRVSTSATLTVTATLASSPSLAVSTTGDLTAPAGFQATPTLAVSTAAALTAAPTLQAASSVRVSTSAAIGNPAGELAAASAVVVGASASLTTNTSSLTAAPTLAISAEAALSATALLLAAAELDVSASAQLTTTPTLATATGLALSTAVSLTVPSPLEASATLSVGASAALTTTARLEAATALAMATGAHLTSLPAQLLAAASIGVSTTGTLGIGGPSITTMLATIGGVRVEQRMRMDSETIQDVLNETQNTLIFDLYGEAPALGAEIRMGLRSLLAADLIFGGTVQRVEQLYDELDENPIWRVSCVDYTWLFGRRRVWRRFASQAGTQTALDLMAYATGFTSAHISAEFVELITIAFDGENLNEAFGKLAPLFGAYYKVDYSKDVHLFTTEDEEAPDPIDGTEATTLNDPPLTVIRDGSQLRTRVNVIGKGARVVAPVDGGIPAGATILPIDDATPFSAGTVIASDGQILSYTSAHAGGQLTTLTGNVAGPSVVPIAQLEPGVAGELAGLYRYAVSYGKQTGETTPGQETTAITAPVVASPASTPGIGASGAVGPLIGLYRYKIAYLTSVGETLPSADVPRTGVALVPGVTVVGGIGGSGTISRHTPGTYNWRTTLVTALGETTGGAAVTAVASAPATPTAPSFTHAATPGVLQIGAAYAYRTTFLTEDGETAPGGASSPLSIAGLSLPGLSFSGFSAFGGLTAFGTYAYAVSLVTAVGEGAPLTTLGVGSSFTSAPSPPFWTGGNDAAGRMAPGVTYFWACSYYSDQYGETPLSAAFSVAVGGTLTQRIEVQLPNGGVLPLANADGIRVYRGVAGGPYQLNAEFRRGAVPVRYWDALATQENGSQYPIQTLRAGISATVNVTPSAEAGVIARRIYRTKAGGSEYFLVGEIQHNLSTTFTDNAFDNSLTVRAPIVSATGRQLLVSGIQTGQSGTIGRRVYRTKAGGSAYYLVAEIKDNISTTLIDNTPDSGLTVAIPTLNTAGAVFIFGQPSVTPPTGPSGVTARRIYRTKAGGSTYFLLAEIPTNTPGSYLDTTPDDALGATTIPALSGVGDQHQLTSLPIGPLGTLARRIYRTKAGGGAEYWQAGQVNDNTTTAWLDAVPDASLGSAPPLVNTAGASSVRLVGIPVGPGSVTSRNIYRSRAGGGDLLYLTTIEDNATTEYVDSAPDSALGRKAPTTSTIGAEPGETVLVLPSTSGFPSPGWIEVDSQRIYYGSIAGASLAGIPVSGAGSITGEIAGNTQIRSLPTLRGVSGLAAAIADGDEVKLWVPRNDAAAQVEAAAAESGDGIHEYVIRDDALDSVAACATRGDAELALFSRPLITVTGAARDPKMASGKTLAVALGPPWNLTTSLRILEVTIDQIDVAPNLYPRYTFKASTAKFSLEDFIRHADLHI